MVILPQNLDSRLSRIPTHSRERALDWSLVLASQGISTTIQPSDEALPWSLLVDATDSEKAFQALRQYRMENRHWRWRKSLDQNIGSFNTAAFAWAFVLIAIYWLSSIYPKLHDAGIMSSSLVAAGQWWRIFTAISLHADLGHLATNLSIGIVLFGFALGKFGKARGLALAFLAGVAGNILSLLVNPHPFYGLGASGMVMGALGLLTAQTVNAGSPNEPRKIVSTAVASGAMLFVLFGLTPGTDIAAHLGGFAAGWLLGAVVLRFPKAKRRSWRNNVGWGVLVGAITIVPWLLAISSK